MNAHQLIKMLSELPEEQKSWPVFVEDGLDPSYPKQAQEVVIKKDGDSASSKWCDGKWENRPYIQIT